MIISEEKYPILEYLNLSRDEFREKNKLCIYNTDNSSEWGWVYKLIVSNWNSIRKEVGSNIEYVSIPFYKAVIGNLSMFDNINAYEFMCNGGYKGVMLIRDMWIIYDFSNPNNQYYFVVTEKDAMNSFYTNRVNGVELFHSTSGYDKIYQDIGYPVTKEFKISRWNQIISGILMFKKYAKTETREIKPNEKIKDLSANEKHLNRSNTSVTILDCTWFTNIIRNTPFGVRGHFRLQPKKNEEGEWIKELIYIEPFMKNGYTIRAKKTK